MCFNFLSQNEQKSCSPHVTSRTANDCFFFVARLHKPKPKLNKKISCYNTEKGDKTHFQSFNHQTSSCATARLRYVDILRHVLLFVSSIQNIHELRFPALQFQDAKYRVPEPSPQHLHCGVWDRHLCLHPQPPLLLLLNTVGSMHPSGLKLFCIVMKYICFSFDGLWCQSSMLVFFCLKTPHLQTHICSALQPQCVTCGHCVE